MFASGNATLQLDQAATFTGSLSDLSAGDSIDLPAFAFASAAIGTSSTTTNTTLTVTDAVHTVGNGAAQITLNGAYTASMFLLTDDGHGGVLLTVENAPTITGDLAITVNKSQTVILTTTDFHAVDPGHTASQLTFTVSNPTNGHVAFAANPGIPITSFTEADLEAGNVLFVHDGSNTHSGHLQGLGL